MLGQQRYWKRRKPKGDASKQNIPVVPIAIGVAVVCLIITVLSVSSLAAKPTATAVPTIAATVVSIATAPTPDPCAEVAKAYLTTIVDQEIHTKWAVAAENTLSALSDPKICASDRDQLAHRYVTDSLEALYATTFSPDKAVQEDELTQYQAIKQRAKDYGVPLPSSLLMAQRASQSGMFLVAQRAYEEAWQDGSFDHADIQTIKSYVSVLYNCGDWWTRHHGASYDDGLRYLATSNHVATFYKTGQAEGWGKLKQLVGDDESIWPEPFATPLVQ